MDDIIYYQDMVPPNGSPHRDDIPREKRFYRLKVGNLEIIVDTHTGLANATKFFIQLSNERRVFYNFYHKNQKRLDSILSYYDFIELTTPNDIFHWRDVYITRSNSEFLYIPIGYGLLSGAYIFYTVFYDIAVWVNNSMQDKMVKLMRETYNFINYMNINNNFLIKEVNLKQNFYAVLSGAFNVDIKVTYIYEYLVNLSYNTNNSTLSITQGVQILKNTLNEISNYYIKTYYVKIVVLAIIKLAFPYVTMELTTITPRSLSSAEYKGIVQKENPFTDVNFMVNNSKVVISLNSKTNLKNVKTLVIFNIINVYRNRGILRRLLVRGY